MLILESIKMSSEQNSAEVMNSSTTTTTTTTAPPPTPTTTPTKQEQPQQPPQLTLQHLTNVLNIFDLASQRGAFRATELEGIGATYNALRRFVEYQQQLLQETQTSD